MAPRWRRQRANTQPSTGRSAGENSSPNRPAFTRAVLIRKHEPANQAAAAAAAPWLNVNDERLLLFAFFFLRSLSLSVSCPQHLTSGPGPYMGISRFHDYLYPTRGAITLPWSVRAGRTDRMGWRWGSVDPTVRGAILSITILSVPPTIVTLSYGRSGCGSIRPARADLQGGVQLWCVQRSC